MSRLTTFLESIGAHTEAGEEQARLASLRALEEKAKQECAAREAEEAEIRALPSQIATDRDRAIEIARVNLNFLASLAMPLVFKLFFPPVLLTAWNLMVDAAQRLRIFTRLAIGIPRGHAKTTLIKLFVLFCILFTKRSFILIISSTAGLACNVLADIVDMLDECNIKALFGDWRIGLEVDRADLKKFGFRGRNIILAAIGAHGTLRGLNLKNERPDVMIFEDVQTRECADSDVQSSALLQWMLGTAMKAKSPFGCVYLYIGNKYPTKNCILRKLQDNPNWIKFISGALLEDGSSLWPELQSVEQLMEEFANDIAMGHPEIFLAEVLNNDLTAFSTRVDFSKIQNCSLSLATEADNPPQGKFIVIDPATDKVNSDFVAIGVYYIYDGLPVLMYALEERLSPGQIVFTALELSFVLGVPLIAVEGTAFQYSLLYWFEFITAQMGVSGIHFMELPSGRMNKNARIVSAIKQLNSGEILLSPDVRALILHQLLTWNSLKTDNRDNLLDLLTFGPKTIEMYGSLAETASVIVQQDFLAATVRPVYENSAF